MVLNSLVISLYGTENVQKLPTDKMNITNADHADILSKSRDLHDITTLKKKPGYKGSSFCSREKQS